MDIPIPVRWFPTASGYYYADSTINGFSHTHLSGTGCADYGDVLLMPTVGPQDVRPVSQKVRPVSPKSQQLPWCSSFSHEREVAEPGYYSVFLNRYGVQAELTSTARAAIHRYTFPEAEDAGFILDLDYSIQHQLNRDMVIEVVSDTEIRGHKRTAYWLPESLPSTWRVPGETWRRTFRTGTSTACARQPVGLGMITCPG